MIGPADNYVSGPNLPPPQHFGAYCIIGTGPKITAEKPDNRPDTLGREEIARRFRFEDRWREKQAEKESFARMIRRKLTGTRRNVPSAFDEFGDIGPAPETELHGEDVVTAVAEVEAIEEIEAERVSDYHAHVINRAGFGMDSEEWAESVKRRWERFQQGRELAASLERTGIIADYAGSNRPRPFIVCPISRRAIALPMLRRVNFFPEQAASRRAEMLGEVETWLAKPGNRWARMGTFTAGKRVPTSEIRETHSALTRRLSKMAAAKWFREVATLVFRAVEFGTPKLEILANGPEWTWHIHAHTIFRPHRRLNRNEWAEFCRRVARYMKAHWDAGRPVEKARELVKYPVKPCDLETLREIGGDMEVRKFFDATLKLRITETLGTLRDQRAALRIEKRKRCKERTRNGDWVRTVRRDWNKRGRVQTREEIRAARRHADEIREAAKIAREALQNLAGQCALPHEDGGTRNCAPMRNRIVARLSPAAYVAPVFEPGFYVWNFDGNFDAIAQHPAVAPALEAVRDYTAFQLETAARREAAHNRSHQSRNCPADVDALDLIHAPPDPLRHHLEALCT